MAAANPSAAALRALQALLMRPAARVLLHLLALAPLAWLIGAAAAQALGANPAEALIRGSGDWALRLLCVTLAITPLRQALGLSALARFRRALGLYAAFYAGLHALAYAWLDMGLAPADIARDIVKRPFIAVGLLTLALLLPLAATSFNAAIRRLGAARWQRLHRLVYAAALLALLHFFWMRAGKNDFAQWRVYAVVVALLLGWRLWRAWRQRQATPPAAAAGTTAAPGGLAAHPAHATHAANVASPIKTGARYRQPQQPAQQRR